MQQVFHLVLYPSFFSKINHLGYFIVKVGNSSLMQDSLDNTGVGRGWDDRLIEALKTISSADNNESGKDNHQNRTKRLTLMSRDGKRRVVSIIADTHYWPTWILRPNSEKISIIEN